MSNIKSHQQNMVYFSRRRLLQSLLATAALPVGLSVSAASAGPRRLILIELAGGNDGLNTVVPYSQPRYFEARPVLAIKRDALVTLSDDIGLHPELAPLKKAWDSNHMHIALGVGYPNPNRSHFRSSDIWNTASGSEQVLDRGWLANGFALNSSANFSAEGIAFGSGYGPFLGSNQSLVLDNPLTFVRQARLMRPVQAKSDNQALNHIVGVRRQITAALEDIETVINSRGKGRIKGSALHRQLVIISDMIAHGARVPVYKATLKGFDTHFHQPNQHKNLMADLGAELASLRDRLIESGDWKNTLVMTYSEFGRRPAENGSRGTDHGTAAPVIIMGGSINGGFSGRQPDFPKHNDQDLAFHLDYRQIYRTVADKWLGAERATDSLRAFRPIELIKS